MSRHEYAGTAADTRVTIGWNRPLATFFVQVIRVEQPAPDADADTETDLVILWVGTALAELPYAADAIRIAKAHAQLPADIGRTLELDRLRTVGEADGPAQHASRTLLSKD